MNIIDTFRYLVSLEQHKHFSRAAQACYITQPALSNAIKALEDEMNIKIVNRGRNYEGLTNEGKRVLATAHQVLHEMDALKQEIASQSSMPSGNLIIGAIPSALPIASNFVVNLKKNFPGLNPILRSMASHELEMGLENLTLDIAFGYIDRPQLEPYEPRIIPQYNEKYFLIRKSKNKNDHLPEKTTWKNASKLSLCLLTSEMHNRALVNKFFSMANSKVVPVMQTDSIFTLLSCIYYSEFSTILSGPMANFAGFNNELLVSKLIEPDSETAIGIMMPSGRQLTIVQETAHKFAKSSEWVRILEKISNP